MIMRIQTKLCVIALAGTAACMAKGGASSDEDEPAVARNSASLAGSGAYRDGNADLHPHINLPVNAAPAAPTEDRQVEAVKRTPQKMQVKDIVQGATDTKAPEGKTRAWFPETFLFEPLVVTDDAGAAVVPVRVPDRLTTWRVLALAHSRSGAQGGAVASFLGTLPTYVDPVVPPFLVQGDVVRLPIQIVNTTAKDVASSLEISAENATVTVAGIAGAGARGGGGARTVPAQGSTLDYATLTADHAGAVKLRVALGGTDAVEKTIEVRPAGRPVTQTRSGTLAAPRRFTTHGNFKGKLMNLLIVELVKPCRYFIRGEAIFFEPLSYHLHL